MLTEEERAEAFEALQRSFAGATPYEIRRMADIWAFMAAEALRVSALALPTLPQSQLLLWPERQEASR